MYGLVVRSLDISPASSVKNVDAEMCRKGNDFAEISQWLNELIVLWTP